MKNKTLFTSHILVGIFLAISSSDPIKCKTCHKFLFYGKNLLNFANMSRIKYRINILPQMYNISCVLFYDNEESKALNIKTA